MAKTQIKRGKQKWRDKPGELNYTGDIESEKVSVETFEYSEKRWSTSSDRGVEKVDGDSPKWIIVNGLNNRGEMTRIGEAIGLDDLVLEDIMHVGERARLEIKEDYIFLIMKNIFLDKEKMSIRQEQISFVLKDRLLISFQEAESDVINYVKEKLLKGIKKDNSDYIMYYIMDLIVDNYFLIISDIEEKIEEIEEYVIEDYERASVEDIYKIRKELLLIRSSIMPLEDVVHNLIREEELVSEDTKKYLRDLKGNVEQLIEYTSIYRESILGLFDIYLSNTSNRMNKVMQTLTIISIMFIPSTFLAGVYGMNFKKLPELGIEYGYPAFWIFNLILMVFIYRYFKKRRWL